MNRLFGLCVILAAGGLCLAQPKMPEAAATLPASASSSPTSSATASSPATKAASAPSEQDRALAAEYSRVTEDLLKSMPAAREPLNFDANKVDDALMVLSGEKAATAKAITQARGLLAGYLPGLRGLKDFPGPLSFTIHKAKGPIVIDGKGDSAAWADAPPIRQFFALNDRTAEPNAETVLRMLWDEKNLYFLFECHDETLDANKVVGSAPVCLTDCVELFLMPSDRWRMYWELNIAPSGSLFETLWCKHDRQWGSIPRTAETVHGLEFQSTILGPSDKPTGYVTEVAFPISELPGVCGPGKAGLKLWMLAARVDKTTKALHFTAWTPICGWFHNVWCYAPVALAE